MCIMCYLSDEKQHSLKIKARNSKDRFEDVLSEYKKIFIEGLKNLTDINQCENKENHQNINDNMQKYLKDLQDDIINNKLDLIDNLFDKVIDIYKEFIKKNHISAYKKLEEYIPEIFHKKINVNEFCRPLFRVIPKPDKENWNYKPHNENYYFHIPFNKRYLVKNQRYSISGLPMCYLADNIQCALQEMKMNLNEVNVGLFLPKVSSFWNKRIYDTTNRIIDNIRAQINWREYDCTVEYAEYDNLYENIDSELANYILNQVLQYPKNASNEGSFTEEYVLPQLLMEYAQENRMIGVKYPSTKSISDTFVISNSDLNYNYCFCVPYDEDNDYSEKFKELFYIILSPDTSDDDVEKYNELLEKYKNQMTKDSTDGYRMSDYIKYELAIEKLFSKKTEEERSDNDTQIMERKMVSKLLEKLIDIVSNPEKYQILKNKQ